MFTLLNEQLIEARGSLRKKDKYALQLEDYRAELENMEESIAKLRKQVVSEKKDVEKLERITLLNFFHTLSGKKEEKLTEEKQEMLAAQHKLEEALKTKTDLEQAMHVLQEKLNLLQNAESTFQQLLLQKEQLILKDASPIAEKIFELNDQEGVVTTEITELDEALAAGKSVMSTLQDTINSLEKAGDWGTFDLFGGGFITDMVKHSHVNDAEASIHRAQTSMRLFQKKLLDINGTQLHEIDISEMLKFADFFFDGFIADIMVQGKIKHSLEQTKDQYRKVEDIVEMLEEQLEQKKLGLDALRMEKQELIEKI